jgi:hypothetical protein
LWVESDGSSRKQTVGRSVRPAHFASDRSAFDTGHRVSAGHWHELALLGEAQLALAAIASTEGLGNAFKRCDRVDLHRARMCFGLDGVAFWRQLCAVPADDAALPCGARLLANAISQTKRRGKWRLGPVIV